MRVITGVDVHQEWPLPRIRFMNLLETILQLLKLHILNNRIHHSYAFLVALTHQCLDKRPAILASAPQHNISPSLRSS